MHKITFLLLVFIPFMGICQWTQLGGDIDGETIEDQSGFSISMSSDGTIVAIGAPGNNGNGNNSGHVRVYKYEMSTWSQIGSDIDGEATADNSGYSVSLSSDGTILAIGAILNTTSTGHVRVYKFETGAWTQVGSDIDGEATSDNFGRSVSLSADGTIVAIGAINNDGTASNSGHVRVYKFATGSWTQMGSDIDGEAMNDNSGYSVRLSADGNTVAIAATRNDGGGNNSGHVRVYKFEMGAWSQVGLDINGEGSNDESGFSVSLSSDGTIVAIGAPFNGSDVGHVRVFKFASGSWGQLGLDIDGEAGGDRSGNSVSLSADGTRVAIGAPLNDGNGATAGHVRVYKFEAGAWTQVSGDIDGEAPGDRLFSVSLSSDGSRVAVGAVGNTSETGSVRIFEDSSTLNIEQNTFGDSFSAYPNPTSGLSKIRLGNNYDTVKVSIYNMLGTYIDQNIHKDVSEINLDTSSFTKGIYFIKISSENKQTVIKLMKN